MAGEQIRNVDGVQVLTVDENDCAGLWRIAEPKLAEGSRAFVLDFAEVEYLNSMNIAAIISLRTKLENKGARLALCGLRDQIASIFRILKLERLFNLGLDCDAAVNAVK